MHHRVVTDQHISARTHGMNGVLVVCACIYALGVQRVKSLMYLHYIIISPLQAGFVFFLTVSVGIVDYCGILWNKHFRLREKRSL